MCAVVETGGTVLSWIIKAGLVNEVLVTHASTGMCVCIFSLLFFFYSYDYYLFALVVDC